MKLLHRLLFQGRHATQDELAASAFQAVDLDQKYGGEPVQVRVTMGKEPRHFMAMFKGKMVIYEVRLLTGFIIFFGNILLIFYLSSSSSGCFISAYFISGSCVFFLLQYRICLFLLSGRHL